MAIMMIESTIAIPTKARRLLRIRYSEKRHSLMRGRNDLLMLSKGPLLSSV